MPSEKIQSLQTKENKELKEDPLLKSLSQLIEAFSVTDRMTGRTVNRDLSLLQLFPLHSSQLETYLESKDPMTRSYAADARSNLICQLMEETDPNSKLFKLLLKTDPQCAYTFLQSSKDKIAHKFFKHWMKMLLRVETNVDFVSIDRLRQYWDNGIQTVPLFTHLLAHEVSEISSLLEMDVTTLLEKNLADEILGDIFSKWMLQGRFDWWEEGVRSSRYSVIEAVQSVAEVPEFDADQPQYQQIINSLPPYYYFTCVKKLADAQNLSPSQFDEAQKKLESVYQELEEGENTELRHTIILPKNIFNYLANSQPNMVRKYWQRTLDLIRTSQRNSQEFDPITIGNLINGFISFIDDDLSKLEELAEALEATQALSYSIKSDMYGRLFLSLFINSSERDVDNFFQVFGQKMNLTDYELIQSIIDSYTGNERELLCSNSQCVRFMIQHIFELQPNRLNLLDSLIFRDYFTYHSSYLSDLDQALSTNLASLDYTWEEAPIVNCYLSDVYEGHTQKIQAAIDKVKAFQQGIEEIEIESRAQPSSNEDRENFWLSYQTKLAQILRLCPDLYDELLDHCQNHFIDYDDLGQTLEHLNQVAIYTNNDEATRLFLKSLSLVCQPKLMSHLISEFRFKPQMSPDAISQMVVFLKKLNTTDSLLLFTDDKIMSIVNPRSFAEEIDNLSPSKTKQLIDMEETYSLPLSSIVVLYGHLAAVVSKTDLDLFCKNILNQTPNQYPRHELGNLHSQESQYFKDDFEWKIFLNHLLMQLGLNPRERSQLLRDWVSAESIRDKEGNYLAFETEERCAYERNLFYLIGYLHLASLDSTLSTLQPAEQVRLALNSGIRVFGRHDPETIVNNVYASHGENIDPENLTGRKAVVMFKALSDHNGALNTQAIDQELRTKIRTLDPKMDVIFIDSNWRDFHYHLAQQRKKRHSRGRPYQDPQPWIHTLILNQHGTQDSIHVNPSSYSQGSLDLQDIGQWDKDPDIDFTPEADVILVSCSTGKQVAGEAAVIDIMTERTRKNVTGPSAVTSLLKWKVSENEADGITITPIFFKSNSRTAKYEERETSLSD